MKKVIIHVFCCLLLVSLSLVTSYAQEMDNRTAVKRSGDLIVRIDQPISEDFPFMEAYVSVTNVRQEPILSLIRGNFSVFADGVEVTNKIDITGFQYTDEGISYLLVVSSNGLMEGEPFQQQLKASVTLMESLREQDRLSMYTFGEEIKAVFENQKKDEKLLDLISKTQLLGGNPHLYDALVYATRKIEKSDRKRKVIIVMSDGRENDSRYRYEQLIKIVDQVNVPIYSIGLKLMAGQNLFRIAQISKHTGGDYLYAEDLSRTPKLMENIVREVLLGYKLSFKITSIPPDDAWHQLHVKVIVKDGEASFFKNFVATNVPTPLWVIIIIIVLALLVITIFIILTIRNRRKKRREMGITKRKCPTCGRRMKDDWDECMFCKFMPPKKRFLFFKSKK